jgi:serine/threonine-protein kinase
MLSETFELIEELGRGGMGVVWRAHDTRTGNDVALKVLHASLAGDYEYLQRFQREVEMASRVQSPYVVRVLGYGVRDGSPYMAMEYIQGKSLRESIAERGRHEWSDAKRILRHVVLALDAIHAAGIVHRDVKPANIIVADGVAKLADFGVARAFDLTRLTATSTMLGTPAYMAPEGQLDQRSDLYSLGIVLYEMLSGALHSEGRVRRRYGANMNVRRPTFHGCRRRAGHWVAGCCKRIRPTGPRLRRPSCRYSMAGA